MICTQKCLYRAIILTHSFMAQIWVFSRGKVKITSASYNPLTESQLLAVKTLFVENQFHSWNNRCLEVNAMTWGAWPYRLQSTHRGSEIGRETEIERTAGDGTKKRSLLITVGVSLEGCLQVPPSPQSSSLLYTYTSLSHWGWPSQAEICGKAEREEEPKVRHVNSYKATLYIL